MMFLRKQIFASLAFCVLFTVLRAVSGQESDTVDERNQRTCQVALNRPTGLASGFFDSLGQTNVLLLWKAPLLAEYFIIRIYTMDGVLRKEIQNIKQPFYNVTNLNPGTTYNATVAAVYVHDTGLEVTSCETKPYKFTTHQACTGGQILTQCLGHCIGSCDFPDPVCGRICSPGCNCPYPTHIWHNGQCIPPPLCPAKKVGVKKPQNLRIIPLPAGSLLLTWDSVEDASGYKIQVKPTVDRRITVHDVTTKDTSVIIHNLQAGQEYVFIVRAIMSPPVTQSRDISGRNTIVTDGVVISSVTDTGFLVTWNDMSEARRYGIVVYAEDKTTVLYSDSHLVRAKLQLVGLAPGTLYYVATTAAKYQNALGPFSPLRGVQTSGSKDPNTEYTGASITGLLPSVVTTTEAPTTTPKPLTHCQAKHAEVTQYYQANPGATNGPEYPNCDSNGLYSTSKCKTGTNQCYCIDKNDGMKKLGSDFGGEASQIPLNCDNYGNFENPATNVQVNAQTTQATITWVGAEATFGYIVVLTSDVAIVRSVIGETTLTFTSLTPDTGYIVEVIAVNGNGWTSASVSTLFTTPNINMPTRLREKERTENSVTVKWDVSADAVSYNVEISDKLSGVVVSSQNIVENTIQLNGLQQSTAYVIRVKSVSQINGVDHESPAAELNVETTCKMKLDVVFALDISGETGWNRFQLEKAFIADIASKIPPINFDTGSRIAALKYFDRAYTMFTYTRFSRTADASGAIRFTRYSGKPPRRGNMLKILYTDYFDSTPKNSNYEQRPDAISVAIVFVGGKSRDIVSTYAKQLAEATNVIAVGVQDLHDEKELAAIASKDEFKVVAPSYEELSSVVGRVISILCDLANKPAKN